MKCEDCMHCQMCRWADDMVKNSTCDFFREWEERSRGAKMQANDRQVTGKLNSENEYKVKIKELEDAIAKCEQAEKEFKSRTCKFRSPTNCDFCAFHSECEEHWKESWIFTFGCGQQHAGKYVKIKGTFEEARSKMFEKYGEEWCFQYSEKEWEAMKNDKNRFWPMETELEVIGEADPIDTEHA